MKLSGENVPALCADLDAALDELIVEGGRDPARWNLGRPGKWTAGQQVAHVGLVVTLMANAFDAVEPALRAGTLPEAPRRGVLQWLFMRVVVEMGYMPRGARATDASRPSDAPDRESTLASLRRDAGRLAALGERLPAAECDRIWIRSPVITTWFYRLPEAVRIHAVHARHHARMIAELEAAR